MSLTDEQKAKREATLIAKYGGIEALAAKRREWQAKSRETYKGTGGAAAWDEEKRKEFASSGGKARWEKYHKDMKRLEQLDEEKATDQSAA